MILTNGQITKVVISDIANVTTPDLDGATFVAVVYVADSAQPIWPGTPLAQVTDFAGFETYTLATNAERYAMV